MKSFLYTIAVLFGVVTVAQASTEAKQIPAEEQEIAIEEVKADAGDNESKKEETEETN